MKKKFFFESELNWWRVNLAFLEQNILCYKLQQNIDKEPPQKKKKKKKKIQAKKLTLIILLFWYIEPSLSVCDLKSSSYYWNKYTIQLNYKDFG